MGTFKLDGKELTFEAGDTIIRAAWRAGIEIPHYCWHPGLSIAANCRMCLVDIKSARPMALPILAWDEKKKDYVEATKNKLQPACQQEVSEGMEVESKSAPVLKAHAAVQEFLLLNHPVDCPICDQAGECKLQDYWATSQKKLKREGPIATGFEPVHKPKAVRFGPTIVYDGERCIMCTRCIRFCDEVVGDHVLDMRERGNKNEIFVSPGRELDHAYTLMTEHVCPVGALTSKDFRFKARVWFLRSAPGVCTGCATGCNSWVDYDPRPMSSHTGGRVYRLRPRDNANVNEFWMCDDGMLSYKRFHEDRVLTGRIRDGARVVEVVRDEAIDAATAVLRSFAAGGKKRIAIVLSAQHSNEDNFLLAKLGTALAAGGTRSVYLAAKSAAGWKADAILRDADPNPNRAGAMAVAAGPVGETSALVKAVLAGEVDLILSLGFAANEAAEDLAGLSNVPHVNLTTNIGPLTQSATIVIPVATTAEASGTFVNGKGVAQGFTRAVHAPLGITSAWETLNAVATALGHDLALARLPDVRAALKLGAGSPATAAEA